jgi:ABC-type polysaccharide/polyol phosphate transport system ATPase subunit
MVLGIRIRPPAIFYPYATGNFCAIVRDMASKNLVKVENVKKAFGQKIAVNDVSFHVRGGEVFGLLGPNGVRAPQGRPA